MRVNATIPKLASIETFEVFAWLWVLFCTKFILAEFGRADFLDMMFFACFSVFAESCLKIPTVS